VRVAGIIDVKQKGRENMARSVFTLVSFGSKRWAVILRSNGAVVAYLYYQSDGSGYRFRLANYSHRMSKLYPDTKAALAALEEEIL
jgi:dipeptidyl aminopeptidase/acylaminoacyl peptidase